MAQFKIIGDCRAKFLPHHVAVENCTEANMHVTPSKRVQGYEVWCQIAYAHAKGRPQDTVIVCPGVIDLLYIDQNTGMSSLRFETVAKLVDCITGLLNEGDVNYHQAHPNSHLIFAPMTGLDLARYPMTNDHDSYHQYIVNAGVERVN